MSLDNQSIGQLLEQFDKDSKALRNLIYKMAWSMRGALSIEDAFAISYNDREIINKLIKENIEVTNKTGLPYF